MNRSAQLSLSIFVIFMMSISYAHSHGISVLTPLLLHDDVTPPATYFSDGGCKPKSAPSQFSDDCDDVANKICKKYKLGSAIGFLTTRIEPKGDQKWYIHQVTCRSD